MAVSVDDDDEKSFFFRISYWVELRPTAAVAQILTFIAIVVYLYCLVPQCVCCYFRPVFFRQVAYILQTIRLFLLMSAILPCVLHGQVRSFSTGLRPYQFAAAVLAALLGNIIAAVGIRKFLECNADSLSCLWRWTPFAVTRCPAMCSCPNQCPRCCPCPEPGECCCPQANRCCPNSDTVCSCCNGQPVCCPKRKPGRPRKNGKCPDLDSNLCCPNPEDSSPCPPQRCRFRNGKPRCS